MKKQILCAALALTTIGNIYAKKNETAQAAPKYVIYLILDGCGVNTVLGTEMYQAELKKYIGRDTLCMTSFPVVSVASTYSGNSPVTDSAASGTCLASGVKSYNGALGVDMDTIPVYSIAQWAHDAGAVVGVGTSVCINHATPGGFYAHQASRNNYYEIAKNDVIASGFDFYGGSDFNIPSAHAAERPAIYQSYRDAGYTLARGYDDYVAKAAGADRMILMQRQQESDRDPFSLPYWIDHKEGQMSSPDVLRAEIDFLYRKAQKKNTGFFLMNEVGGKIDFACHPNDAATAFAEVATSDSAVRIAYEFYKEHPSETLILVTADHETGGLTIGRTEGGYSLNLQLLQHQHCSLDEVTRHMQALRTQTYNKVTWEQIKELLSQDFDFWTQVEISAKEEESLKKMYERSFLNKMPNEKNLYSENEPMAAEAMRLLNMKARVGWTSAHHTAGLVPVLAIGPGSEQFCGFNDNGDFAPKLAEIAGWPIQLRK